MITSDYQIIINFQFTLTFNLPTIGAFAHNNDPETSNEDSIENTSRPAGGGLCAGRPKRCVCTRLADQAAAHHGGLGPRWRHRRDGPRRGRPAGPAAQAAGGGGKPPWRFQ